MPRCPAARTLLCLCLTATTAAQEVRDAEGGGWRVRQLDLEIDADPAQRKLEVAGELEIELTLDRSSLADLVVNVRSFALEWVALDAPEGIDVDLNLRHARFESARIARLRLAEPAPRGTRIPLTFRCRIRKRSNEFFVGKDIAFTNWVGGWHPFPAPAPGGGFDSALLAAPGTTTLRIPRGWRSHSNGMRTASELVDGQRVERWRVTNPVARSFAIGPYTVGRHQTGDRGVDVLLLGGKEPERAERQAAAIAEAIDALEDRFGPFPYARFGVVEIPNGTVTWTAASQQGFILAKSKCFDHGRNLPLFAHETSHAWWGNLVGQRGAGSIVCSESLAQYGAALAIEAIEGRKAMVEFMRFSRTGYSPRQCARGYFAMARQGQDAPLSQLRTGGWHHDLSDAKGHWVFHMLRRRVGDTMFFDTLRDLVRRFTDKEMALADLRAAFVAAAPAKARLETFFAQWFDRTGAPILDCAWRKHGDGIEATITQEQKGEPYHLVLDVTLWGEGTSTSHTLELSKRTTTVTLPATFEVQNVAIDPAHALLLWTPEYGEKP